MVVGQPNGMIQTTDHKFVTDPSDDTVLISFLNQCLGVTIQTRPCQSSTATVCHVVSNMVKYNDYTCRVAGQDNNPTWFQTTLLCLDNHSQWFGNHPYYRR